MKRTRARYHYAIRVAKRDEYEIRKQKLAMSRCGDADMWRELKKINPLARNIPSTVDGACGNEEIAELFVTKYEQLFNSVPTNREELEEVRLLILYEIGNNPQCNITFSSTDIIKCIKKSEASRFLPLFVLIPREPVLFLPVTDVWRHVCQLCSD